MSRSISLLRGIDLNKYLQVLSLPDEFSRSSNKEILAYLKELNSSSSAEICRMRVMIVGPGDAGKTTLVERLLTDEFSPGQFSMTDGVSMKEWKPIPEVNLSLWDFGGQQVYLNSHAILFNDKTLYLLVWNPRVGTDLRVLESYVLNVRSRSQSAHIMLVTTHGSEVGEKAYQGLLQDLSKYNYLSHHNVDSCTGLGIAELKQGIVKFVSEDYAEHSRVLVPGWYPSLESKLKELSKSGFSIEREEFKSLCVPLWRSLKEDTALGKEDPDPNFDLEFSQAMKTVLTLFHHWGVIFVLKKFSSSNELSLSVDEADECGDIVLNPQSLADVFKCVITCHVNSTGVEQNKELFEEGILNHNQLDSIWSGYESRLCPQFLELLHHSELCYEIFDSNGASTHRSLVPSLFPVSHRMEETDLRAELFPFLAPSPRVEITKKTMISHGSVKISFDCLLPNFFPKLMVRLRHLSSPSPAHISRHHFVVRLPEWDREDKVARLSWVCVVEDLVSQSLLLYPGGYSFGATSICNGVVEELMRESFSGMCVKDVVFTAEDQIFSKKKLLSRFDQSPTHPTLSLDNGTQILLTFLSPLLSMVDVVTDSTWALDGAANGGSETPPAGPTYHGRHSRENDHSSLHSTLRTDLSQLEKSGHVVHKFALGHTLIITIPIFRQHLGVPHLPSILWLVGRSSPSTPSSSSSSSCDYYLYAVSPSLSPNLPWEIVPDSAICLTNPSSHSLGAGVVLVDSSSVFLMKCLDQFLDVWPHHICEWSLSFPEEGMGPFRDKDVILKEMRQKEKHLFVSHRDMLGVEVQYWKELLDKQQGISQAPVEEQLGELKKMMMRNHKELSSNQRTMMTQLDRVEGSLSQLTQQLSGVLVDIRVELLQARTSSSEEALAEMRELWETRMDNLERVISSSAENTEAQIKKEMRGLEVQLASTLCDLEVNVDPQRMITELGRVRDELISANRGRLQGDEASTQKLDQILSEMRSVQSQLDRVEEKMTQFFGKLSHSLDSVHKELQEKGNSEGLQELRDLWIGRMSELEDLILQSTSNISDAAIEKLVRKLDTKLNEKLFYLDVSLENLTPQLTEMKQQLLAVAAGVRDGEEKSQQRMDSMMLELKTLQTQFVEVIHLQTEMSRNLKKVCVLPPSPLLCAHSQLFVSLGSLFVEEVCRECEHPHLPHHICFGSDSTSRHGDRSEGNGWASVGTLQSHARPAGDRGIVPSRQVPHRSHLRGVWLSFRR
jgi:hypothetical protein